MIGDRIRAFNLRDWRRHPGRTAMSLVVVAVAATLLVAVLGIAGSITGSADRFVAGIGGNASLEVSGVTDTGLPQAVQRDVARGDRSGRGGPDLADIRRAGLRARRAARRGREHREHAERSATRAPGSARPRTSCYVEGFASMPQPAKATAVNGRRIASRLMALPPFAGAGKPSAAAMPGSRVAFRGRRLLLGRRAGSAGGRRWRPTEVGAARSAVSRRPAVQFYPGALPSPTRPRRATRRPRTGAFTGRRSDRGAGAWRDRPPAS